MPGESHPTSEILAEPESWPPHVTRHVETCAACRASARLLGDWTPGTTEPIRLGAFRLDARVAQGGMGEVWRGTSVATGLPAAIKVVRPQSSSAQARRMFEREVQTVASLDHPNIVVVLDVGEIETGRAREMLGEGSWLAMEYLSGGGLDAMQIHDWRVLERVLRETLQALAHAHARGVIHRDLKPANVLLGMPGDTRPGLKLCDFGIATTAGASTTSAGTVPFMAPEQLAPDDRPGPWTDLYAVGVLGWALAARELPFTGDPAHQRAAKSLGIPALWPRLSVPSAFVDWLSWLSDPNPRERPASCAHALSGLAALGPPDMDAVDTRAARGGTVLTWQTLPDTTELDPPTEPLQGEARASGYTRHTLPDDWRNPRRRAPPIRLSGTGLRLVAFRDPALIGRQRERDRLWAWVRGEGPDPLILHGPEGVGRTALGRWLVRATTEQGGLGVAVHADRPHAALMEMLTGLSAFDPDFEPPDPRSTSATLADLVRSRLGAIGRPVVVQLDGSLEAGRAVADACPEGARILWTEADPGGEYLEVGPMPIEAISELTRLHAGLEPTSAMRLADLSQGLPGLALERLRAALATATWGPGGLELTDVDRPSRGLPPLEPDEVRALAIGAAVGRSVPATLWEPLAPVGWSAVRALVRHGSAIFTETGWAFTDPVVQTELLETLDDLDTVRRGILERIEASHLPEKNLHRARQRTALGELSTAFADWRDALWDRLQLHGCHAAAALAGELEEALDQHGLSADDPRRGAVRAARAQIWRAGGEREACLREVAALTADPAAQHWPASLTRAWLEQSRTDIHGDHQAAWRALQRAESWLDRVDPNGDELAKSALDGATLAMWVRYDKARLLGILGRRDERVRALRSIPDDAAAAGCPEVEADACLELAMELKSDPKTARELAERALRVNERLGRHVGAGDAWSVLGHVAMSAGDPSEALRTFTRGYELHESLGSVYGVFPRLGAARALMHLERIDEAGEVASPAVLAARELGPGITAYARIIEATIHALSGDIDRALAGLELARVPAQEQLADVRELLTEFREAFADRPGERFWAAADAMI